MLVTDIASNFIYVVKALNDRIGKIKIQFKDIELNGNENCINNDDHIAKKIGTDEKVQFSIQVD